ncbi:hypothetical protein F5Y09DRAFT_345868 [Xylaria sp. FL1042]|nr:hypothetical protein F5Y09DRAFT_345868 [Xylaria sp. FL1042]
MVKENDVIAIIIILLFIVLAAIAFGIYRLVHVARHQGSLTSESSSGSSDEIAYITSARSVRPFTLRRATTLLLG